MSTENCIDYEVSDRVAVVRLTSPDNYNAMTSRMSAALAEALETANDDEEVRAVVLTGAGEAFCAGGETKGDLPSATTRPTFLAKRSPMAGGIRSFVSQITDLEKPTIAAVNGVAAGGGFSLACACDLRIASDRARMGTVFIRRGLAPDTGSSYLLPRLVGLAKANEIVFTGDVLDAEECLRIGLVNRVVPHDELMESAMTIARRIAEGAPDRNEVVQAGAPTGRRAHTRCRLRVRGIPSERVSPDRRLRRGDRSIQREATPSVHRPMTHVAPSRLTEDHQ